MSVTMIGQLVSLSLLTTFLPIPFIILFYTEVVTSHAAKFIKIFPSRFLSSLEFLDRISQLQHYKNPPVVLNFQLNIGSIWSSFWGTGWVVTFFPSLLLSFSSMWFSTFRVIRVQKPEVHWRVFPSVGHPHPGSNWDNHNEGSSDSVMYSHTYYPLWVMPPPGRA